MTDGWVLRRERLTSGLTAAQLARASGTSETNVAAYERGAKTPSSATLARLRLLLRAGAASPIFVNRLLTVPAAAAGIRKGLRNGWPPADLLRIVRESLSNARWATSEIDLAAFLAPPSTTGDPRWNALLAGAVEDLALQRGVPVPDWTAGNALPSFWFVSDSRDFDAYALAHSPVSLKVRGVMLDPSDLVSV
ncbi:MAG: helix-turn-helix domain-containing protein [Acidimicrobiales bacterium]